MFTPHCKGKIQMKTGKRWRAAAFTLVEIMIVVAIIGLLAAIAIPNFVKARANSQKNACISNLHQIDSAIQEWALENHAQDANPVTFTDITPYLGRSSGGSLASLYCPADPATAYASSYSIVDCKTAPVCLRAGATHVLN
jgi:prepilin-type N-terminal cleavage/methylation domain-containing protein